jgi:hypothetical protein
MEYVIFCKMSKTGPPAILQISDGSFWLSGPWKEKAAAPYLNPLQEAGNCSPRKRTDILETPFKKRILVKNAKP